MRNYAVSMDCSPGPNNYFFGLCFAPVHRCQPNRRVCRGSADTYVVEETNYILQPTRSYAVHIIVYARKLES
jgi:hypothetical protein